MSFVNELKVYLAQEEIRKIGYAVRPFESMNENLEAHQLVMLMWLPKFEEYFVDSVFAREISDPYLSVPPYGLRSFKEAFNSQCYNKVIVETLDVNHICINDDSVIKKDFKKKIVSNIYGQNDFVYHYYIQDVDQIENYFFMLSNPLSY